MTAEDRDELEYQKVRRGSTQTLTIVLVLIALFLAGWGAFIAWDASENIRGLIDMRGLAMIGVAVVAAILARVVQAEGK